jgi:hypothetical protein
MELFEELCLQAQGGGAPRFRVIMAWSVDRLERSLQDLMAFLSEIHAKGVELCLHQQGMDTTTPSGGVGTSVIQRIKCSGRRRDGAGMLREAQPDVRRCRFQSGPDLDLVHFSKRSIWRPGISPGDGPKRRPWSSPLLVCRAAARSLR